MSKRLVTNEGKCCDAVLRLLERRHGAYRSNVRRHDDDPTTAARVELTFDLDGQSFAMEHTLAEPFEGFLAQNNSEAQSIRDVEEELRARLPADSDFLLWVPSKCFKGRTTTEIDKIKRIMIDALIAAASDMPIEPNHRSGGGVLLKPPGLSFEFGFRRFERTDDLPQVRALRAVEDVAMQRQEGMKRVCAKKQPKLAWWKARGARTILVLENNDIQLSNQHNIAAALAEVEAELGTIADEVHLIGTYIERTWWATRLRIDGVRFPELYAPDETIAKELDPTELTDLTAGRP